MSTPPAPAPTYTPPRSVSVNGISTSFPAIALRPSASDDKLEDDDLELIYTTGQEQNVFPTGFNRDHFQRTFAMFAWYAAMKHANHKTNFETAYLAPAVASTGQTASPQAINFNRIRDLVNNMGVGFPAIGRTFATTIYNTSHRKGIYCEKFAKFGFNYAQRWVAFVGAEAIDQTQAVPPLTQDDIVAIQSNKRITIERATKQKILLSNYPELTMANASGTMVRYTGN